MVIPITFFFFSSKMLSQTMEYVTSEVTLKAPSIMFGVSLLDFNLGLPTLSFSGGADLNFYFKHRLSAEAGFRYAYYDMTKRFLSDSENENHLRNYSDFRIGGRFHFVDKTGKKEMRANISFEQNGSTTITKFLPVEVPTRKIIALHYGFQRYTTSIHKKWPATVTTNDGTGLTEWQSSTNINVGMIYAGISFVDIMKATINSGGAHWNAKWYRDSYFDVLYAPIIKIEDVHLKGKTYVMQGGSAKGFETNPFGVRYGYSNMAKKIYLRYEIGWFPGLQWKGFFTQATFGFSIVKVKK